MSNRAWLIVNRWQLVLSRRSVFFPSAIAVGDEAVERSSD